MVEINLATSNDYNEIYNIYAQYIDTNITFEYTLPTFEVFKDRLTKIQTFYPLIIAKEFDKSIGYAYASSFRERIAYQWLTETSVYVDKHYHNKGIGKQLYSILFEYLTLQEFTKAIAVITLPNDSSVLFHQKFDFIHNTTISEAGFKNGKWHDIGIFEKLIGQKNAEPKSIHTII